MRAEPVSHLLLRPRAPLLVRDGRPFTSDPGGRAVTLDWPLPQTVAGAVRSFIGDTVGFDWSADGPARARGIAVHGPLLLGQNADGATVYLPAPRDALLPAEETAGRGCWPLRPMADGEAGCDLPDGLLPVDVPPAGKPRAEYAFWSLDDHVRWLTHPDVADPPRAWLPALPQETRVHVALDHERGAFREGLLFSTTGLVFPDAPLADRNGRAKATHALALLCRVMNAPAPWRPGPGLLTMGGEGRIVAVEPPPCPWPMPPADLMAACAAATRLRIQLATPAIFPAGGWRPDWIDPSTLVGTAPGTDGPALHLVSAVVGRRVPVSGWRLEPPHGPKPIRYAVPAGSVYFFESLAGPVGPALPATLWLGSVCADRQDRDDGFGLALPGVW